MAVSKWYSAGTVASTLVLLSYVISYILPYWLVGSHCSATGICETHNIGLWRGCVARGSGSSAECSVVDSSLFDATPAVSPIPTSEVNPEILAARILGAVGILATIFPLVIHATLAVSKRGGRTAVVAKQKKWHLRLLVWIAVLLVLITGAAVVILMGRLAGDVHEIGACLWIMAAGWVSTVISAILIDRKMVRTLLKESGADAAWKGMNPVVIATTALNPGPVTRGYELTASSARDPFELHLSGRSNRSSSTRSVPSFHDASVDIGVFAEQSGAVSPHHPAGVSHVRASNSDHRYRAFSDDSVHTAGSPLASPPSSSRGSTPDSSNVQTPPAATPDATPKAVLPPKSPPAAPKVPSTPVLQSPSKSAFSMRSDRSPPLNAKPPPGALTPKASTESIAKKMSPAFRRTSSRLASHSGSCESEMDLEDIGLASDLQQLQIDHLDITLSASKPVDLDELPLPPVASAPAAFVRKMSQNVMGMSSSSFATPPSTARHIEPPALPIIQEAPVSSAPSTPVTPVNTPPITARADADTASPMQRIDAARRHTFRPELLRARSQSILFGGSPDEASRLAQNQNSIGRNSPSLLLGRARAPTGAFAGADEAYTASGVSKPPTLKARHSFSLSGLFTARAPAGAPEPPSVVMVDRGTSSPMDGGESPVQHGGGRSSISSSAYKTALRSLTTSRNDEV